MANIGAGLGGAASGAATGASIGGPVGGAIGGILGGLGGLFGGGDDGDAARQEAFDKYIAVLKAQGVPSPQDFVSKYGFVDPNDLQTFQPLLEKEINQQQSELKGISTDPAYKQAQMQALAKLSNLGNEGLSVTDEAARNDIVNAVGRENKSQTSNILSSLAQRGQLGSGNEIAARLAANQGSYENQAKAAQDAAAAREQRALQAVLNAGTLGSTLQQNEFGQQRDIASAQDAINRFNASQQGNVQQRNIASQNTAGTGSAELANKALYDNLNLKNKQADQLSAGTIAAQKAANTKAEAVASKQAEKAGITDATAQAQASAQSKGLSSLTDVLPSLFGTAEDKKKPTMTSDLSSAASSLNKIFG